MFLFTNNVIPIEMQIRWFNLYILQTMVIFVFAISFIRKHMYNTSYNAY